MKLVIEDSAALKVVQLAMNVYGNYLREETCTIAGHDKIAAQLSKDASAILYPKVEKPLTSFIQE